MNRHHPRSDPGVKPRNVWHESLKENDPPRIEISKTMSNLETRPTDDSQRPQRGVWNGSGWGSRMGSWLGMVTIVLMGVLVSPSSINDLFGEAQRRSEDRMVTVETSRPAEFERESRTPSSEHQIFRAARPITSEKSLDRSLGWNGGDPSNVETNADSPPHEPVAFRLFRTVRNGIEQGLRRLRQVPTLVRSRIENETQRMPASFIPFRS
jgi:hypothetical protein